MQKSFTRKSEYQLHKRNLTVNIIFSNPYKILFYDKKILFNYEGNIINATCIILFHGI
jgi:hypothetical protein